MELCKHWVVDCGCAKKNQIKLNNDKTEVIVFNRSSDKCEFKNSSFRISDNIKHTTPAVRNLVVYVSRLKIIRGRSFYYAAPVCGTHLQ